MIAPFRLADEDWIDRLERSVSDRSIGLPGFPDEKLQVHWIGRSGAGAIRIAAPFYRLIKHHTELKGPLLDFGVGWGRIVRFFLNELSEESLFGVDVNKMILDECRRLGVPGQFSQIENEGHLPYADNTFEVVCAYSVFTHLPEKLSDHWASEIERVLQPGGVFIFTLLTASFFEICVEAHENPASPDWMHQYGKLFSEPRVSKKEFMEGKFIYVPTDGRTFDCSLYGWAGLPLQHIEKNWNFETVEYLNDLNSEQGACVLRKK